LTFEPCRDKIVFIRSDRKESTVKYIRNAMINGTLTDIGVEDGKIAFIGKCDKEGLDLGGMRLYPGLIDIHSHGCNGVDTMDDAPLDAMARFQLEHGTTTWYPTTMTMPLGLIATATHKNTKIAGGANIPGFHLEGPFINPKFKGAQNPDHIFAPKAELIEQCEKVAMITIAPELPGSRRLIESTDAIVSLGHSDADYDTAKGAFSAGVRCLTHTCNAMNGIHHRAPGPIIAAAETDGVYAQVISDGLHIHPATVRMLITLFGDERIILISDSMAATGCSDGEYDFGGMPIIVKDGVARTAEGNLAGSTTTLFGCVKKLISFGIEPERAVKMATENPARLMGLNKGSIEIGYDADFIIVDDDFNLVRAIARGEF
jgi:N-acetylglucosamine-6-phosphate deacetylase